MISVQKALDLVLSQSLPRQWEEVGLADALGKVLAEPLKADRDAPPFDRVTMDGIALHSSVLGSRTTFQVENIQPAGAAQQRLSDKNNCIEVMTGAMLPDQTDCVIPYEQLSISDGVAIVKTGEHRPLQNIHFKGMDAKKGDLLLTPGEIVTPAVAGILAAIGISRPKVLRLPKIAVCSTGDELVDIDQQPENHQIRKSNAQMLQAALLDLGITSDSFHLMDDQVKMTGQLATLLKDYQVILFSGAVSKGKYDFLPAVLQELGMDKIIHGVAQKPGKPFLFGTFPGTLVFGFPGNPASTFVCFHTYFKPWLMQYLGLPIPGYTAVLDQDVHFGKPMTYHLLVSLSLKEGTLVASPLQSSGSGDLVHLAQATAVISLPPDKDTFHAGECFPVNPFGKNLLLN